VSAAVRRFVDANQRLAEPIERRLAHAQVNLTEIYNAIVAERMRALPPGSVVVDVGGGRSCAFARHRASGDGVRLIGVDVSADELAHNEDVDEKIVADVVEGLPIGDREADLVVSHSVVEHLADSDAYVAEAARALKPGGLLINTLPSKYAPFSLINRVLPERAKARLLQLVFPWSEGVLGYRTYYDNCSYRAMRRVHQRHGFELVDSRVSYYQSSYFAPVLPAYLISVGYELVIARLDLRQLAASLLIVGRKR
jgi:ubiquinone/menaquinone biosynthesis C-methylase UbiE